MHYEPPHTTQSPRDVKVLRKAVCYGGDGDRGKCVESNRLLLYTTVAAANGNGLGFGATGEDSARVSQHHQ